MKIVIAGTGNVASVLGRRFLKAGHSIAQVLSRNASHAKILADEWETDHGDFNTAINKEADLYLFAVSDIALYDLDKYFSLGNKLVVHTAGSVSKEVLAKISNNYGVLYPLQSLRKDLKDTHQIPFLVDANTEDNLQIIESLALQLDPLVQRCDDDKRMKTHVAAVFINNFTNHLYAQSEDFCLKEHIDFDILKPLMMETATRILTHSPKEVLTGPAVRNDTFTLQKHLQVLSNHPKQKYLYMKLTDSIITN